jgi:hypothetical protein
LGDVAEQLEMDFLKPKEFFVGNMPLHKNLSRFLHNHHLLGDMKRFFSGICQI